MYRIKNLEHGRYSKGGITPYFTKYGKVWNELRFVKAHLNQFASSFRGYNQDISFPYDNCVVESLDSGEVLNFDIRQYVKDKHDEYRKRQVAKEERNREFKQRLKELNREFGRDY